jgi:hypothetical protein
MGVGDWETVTTDDAEKMQSLDGTELRAFMKAWAQAFN